MSLFANDHGPTFPAIAMRGLRRIGATGPRMSLPRPNSRNRSRPGPNWERITLVAASALLSFGVLISAAAALATLR